MSNEMIEIGKTCAEWAQNYENISGSVYRQTQELKSLYHKTLMMRYETALIGLQYLKILINLQVVKATLEDIEIEESAQAELS